MNSMLDRLEHLPERASRNPSLWWCRPGSARHRLVALLAATLFTAGAAHQAIAQSSTTMSGEPISIIYGYITHHYLTAWQDRNLPAGVLRGLPPLVEPPLNQQTDDPSPRPAPSATNATSTEVLATQSADDVAILYQLDLGERGMQMIVSSKRGLKPGHCVALEQRGQTNNLRRVSEAFCGSASREVTESVGAMRSLQADYCMQALARLRDNQAKTESIDPITEIRMLCDGG